MLLAAWLTLLLLQWTLPFLVSPYAYVTTVMWTALVVAIELRPNGGANGYHPKPVDLGAVACGLLLAGSLLVGTANVFAMSVWILTQTVTVFYMVHHSLPRVGAASVLEYLIWGVFITLSFFTTFAVYSVIAWIPRGLFDVPSMARIGLGVISILGAYVDAVQSGSIVTFMVAGAILALNFVSVARMRFTLTAWDTSRHS